MNKRTIDKKTEGQIRQFYRLLISYNDFKHAIMIADYILDNKLHNQRGESKVLLEALNCAMIMSYCRPFSCNDKKNQIKIPDLPTKILNLLNKDELEVHRTAVDDRNKLLAHSDSEGWNLRPFIIDTGRSKVLLPLGNYARAPLTHQATKTFKSAALKLREEVFSQRIKLEPQLMSYFEIIKFGERENKLLNNNSLF